MQPIDFRHNRPIVTLHVKGTANIFSGADTHTGSFFNGTSSVDGIEMVSSSTDAYMSIQRTDGGGYGLHVTKKNALSNTGLVGFLVNDILVGAITTNGTTTTYYSSPSDVRLKENIHPTQFGLSNLMKVTVADYNFKADNAKTLQTGFLAQDLLRLYPQAVQTGGENEKTNPWMVDYSKLTPLLVKSVQQQQELIEKQKNEIDILKTQVADLTNAVNALNHNNK
jgi:polyhydroxyalkanoate synthesis regulator phasin